MCSIGEDDFGDDGAKHAMIPESTAAGTIAGGNCNKCGIFSDRVYKLNYRAAECRECFFDYARHKFRGALGASKVLPKNAEVLLHVDGSAESLVLLDMLHYAQTQNTFRRLHCNVRVLCINREHGTNEVLDLDALHNLQTQYAPFEFYVTEMNVAPLCKLQRLSEYKKSPTTNSNELSCKLNKMRNLTSRQDYLHQQEKHVIAAAAQQLHCGYVFESCISSTLATRLLQSIALGRGGSASLDVALLDDRLHGGIILLRPLKDLTDQEVQFYLNAQNLTPLRQSGQQYGHKQGPTASLQNLTSAFVENLQQNYASTVSTVFRTGGKIAANRPHSGQAEPVLCEHCLSPLDYALSDTLLAIEYSRAVSETGATLGKSIDALEACAKEGLLSANKLCHACRNMQKELSSGLLL